MPESSRLILSHSVEALFVRALGKQLTPELVEQLRRVGLDLDRLLPAYPLAIWEKSLDVAARHLHPELPVSEAMRQLGEITVNGWAQTFVGRAMITMAKMAGPKRTLMRFPMLARSSNNFSHMFVRELETNDLEVICEPYAGWPEYVEGVLHAVVALSGGESPQVTCLSHDLAAKRVVFRVTWKS